MRLKPRHRDTLGAAEDTEAFGNSIYDHAQREMSDLRFGIKLRTTSFYFRFIFVLFRRRSTTYSIACTKMVNDDRK